MKIENISSCWRPSAWRSTRVPLHRKHDTIIINNRFINTSRVSINCFIFSTPKVSIDLWELFHVTRSTLVATGNLSIAIFVQLLCLSRIAFIHPQNISFNEKIQIKLNSRECVQSFDKILKYYATKYFAYRNSSRKYFLCFLRKTIFGKWKTKLID